MAQAKKYIVSVSGDRSVRDVEQDLIHQGFQVGEVLDAVGSIKGSADPAIVKQLRTIPGVDDIEEESRIDIGKPGDSETW